MIKYIMYVRKSSEAEDRQIQSIDDQRKVLRELAVDKNIKVVEELKEAKSAKAPGRKIFNEMIEKIKGGIASGIICWKLDRLSRNPVDSGELQWLLQQNTIEHILAYDRSYYPDDNALLMSVEQGMANQFIRDLSKNTKRGLLQKVERGWYPAPPTLGYLSNPAKKKGEKEIIKDPNSFELVRRIFDLMLTGIYTPPKILKIATEEWGLRNRFGREVNRSTIYRIMSDTMYYGEFEYPKGSGKVYKGKHQPIITIDEFCRIQRILKRNDRPRPKTKSFTYSGLIRCAECGAMVTAEDKTKQQKNGNVHHYTYYHCTKRVNPDCTQKTIEVKVLENQIMESLACITIPQEFLNWAVTELQKNDAEEMTKIKAIEASQKKRVSELSRMQDNLIDLRLKDEITELEYRSKKNEMDKQKNKLESQLNDTDGKLDKSRLNTIQIFEFSNHVKEKFIAGDKEDKREILSAVSSNLSLKDRKLQITFEKPFIPIKEMNDELLGVKGGSERLEPLQTTIKKRTKDISSINRPLMLRR